MIFKGIAPTKGAPKGHWGWPASMLRSQMPYRAPGVRERGRGRPPRRQGPAGATIQHYALVAAESLAFVDGSAGAAKLRIRNGAQANMNNAVARK